MVADVLSPAMLPVRYQVRSRHVESPDAVTLRLDAVDWPLPAIEPGQFAMLGVPGIGEVPISSSGDPDADFGTLTHTVRRVGAVSGALYESGPGTVLDVRGPFGTVWGVDAAAGHDLVIVAGGIGLAPLRPVVRAALRRRPRYGRVVVIVGARRPDEFLFRTELDDWVRRPDLEVALTVDRPAPGWEGAVGFVTEPLARVSLDSERTIAFCCGPEPMMRFSARILQRQGVPPGRIRISLERNMQCGIGLCGHCQLGQLLICRDGPIVDYAVAEPLLNVREL